MTAKEKERDMSAEDVTGAQARRSAGLRSGGARARAHALQR
jgi:hypothetical protein